MRAKCVIDGCIRPRRGRGYCATHWARWRKNGDPLKLAVKTAPNEARNFLEEVVLGYDEVACLVWPFLRNRGGYGVVSIARRPRIVSRVVCERTYGPPPSHDHFAAHSCGKGKEGCVAKRHLSWKTKRENELEKEVHGTRLRGEQQPQAKLNVQQVRRIVSLKGEVSQSKLAGQFGVSRQTIGEIHRGETWASVTMEAPK